MVTVDAKNGPRGLSTRGSSYLHTDPAGSGVGETVPNIPTAETKLQERWRKLQSLKIKVFSVPREFKAHDAWQKIVEAPFPKNERAARVERAPAARQQDFVEQALNHGILTKQQETYLFKKMHYYKFLAQREIKRLGDTMPSQPEIENIEALLNKADGVMQEIAGWNYRLAVKRARDVTKKINGTKLTPQEALTNCAEWLQRGISCFNYKLGIRLSTYLWPSVTRGVYRDLKKSERAKANLHLGAMEGSLPERPESGITERANNYLAQRIEGLLAESSLNEREIQVVCLRHGIGNGGHKVTLEELGSRFGVTKERIRQIEVEAMGKLRFQANQGVFSNPVDDL
jgi:RNA polymerase sigma factor (sigma-70 family)